MWSDDDEFKKMSKREQAYFMIIKDWSKTPLYHMVMNGMSAVDAIIKYCNITSQNRLAKDLGELDEYKERIEDRV